MFQLTSVHHHALDVGRVGPGPWLVDHVVDHHALRPELGGDDGAVLDAVPRAGADLEGFLLEVNVRAASGLDEVLPGPVLARGRRARTGVLQPDELGDGVTEGRDSEPGSQGVEQTVVVDIFPDDPVVGPVVAVPGPSGDDDGFVLPLLPS